MNKRYLHRIRSFFHLYRRSRVLTFFVDHSREARRLRRSPHEAADEAHLTGAWNFDNPYERAWQSHVLATVAAHAGERWNDALEVGCSEGVFTAELASRCRSVAAYEISPVAAARAAERCGEYSNVRILERDAVSQEIEGQYDLVFVMDVLWLVVGRSRRSSIVPKLANAMRDGGLLIFSDSRMPKPIRHRFWNLFFPTGADEWARLFERTPELTVVSREVYRYSQSGQDAAGYWDKLFVIYRKQSQTDVPAGAPALLGHDTL